MYEVCFLSDAYDDEVIETTLEIADSAFSAMREMLRCSPRNCLC